MEIYIIGVNHGLQTKEQLDIDQDRTIYTEELKLIIDSFCIGTIIEEIHKESLAKNLADSKGIKYELAEIGRTEGIQHGYRENYDGGHKAREEQWLEKVNKIKDGNCGVLGGNVLFIIGNNHTMTFPWILYQAGYKPIVLKNYVVKQDEGPDIKYFTSKY